MAHKRKDITDPDDQNVGEKAPRISWPMSRNSSVMCEKRLIIVLENAQLEPIKMRNNFELLNCDDHKESLRRMGRDLSSARPDITHQCLLMLFDSPLNRAGLLQVYVHTERNALIEIHPQTRVPRTFVRFSGLMVQLLHKLNIRASNGPVKLMKVIKNPVSDHVPVGCKKVTMSFHSKKLVRPIELVPENEPVVIIVGAMAHGKVDVPYSEDEISISEYPLSAALTCTKLCSAFEEAWGVH